MLFQSASSHARMSLEGGALVAAVVGGLAAAALLMGALLAFFRHWMQVRLMFKIHMGHILAGGSVPHRPQRVHAAPSMGWPVPEQAQV